MKYTADPRLVRKADGRVPRHREVIGWGEERMVFKVVRSEAVRDCCTRVLRRSAGWSRMAVVTPERAPEPK